MGGGRHFSRCDRSARDGWPLAIGRMQSSVRALADDTVATPSRKRFGLRNDLNSWVSLAAKRAAHRRGEVMLLKTVR